MGLHLKIGRVIRVHVLADLLKGLIAVPEQQHAQACSGCRLTVFFHLENPFNLLAVSFLFFQDELVFAVRSINEGIDVGQSEVFLSTVDVVVVEAAIGLEVLLVDLVWVLGWQHVKVLTERLKMLMKLAVRDDRLELGVVTHVWVSLPSEHEGHLL